MLQFFELWFRNFQSYGNNVTRIQLNKPGTHLITGTNGTGKSTIIQALTFVVYGKVISPTKANEPKVDDLINNINKKHMEVGCIFHKSNIGYYKLLRARKMKSGADGNYIKVYFNADAPEFDDTHEITLGGTGTTDKYIENIIGMPFEMFVRIVVMSAGNTPFLDLPVSSATQTSQISCIEKLFNITVLSEKGNALKQVMKNTDDIIKNLKKDIEYQETSRARDLKQLEVLKASSDKWDITKQQQITELEAKLSKIQGVDIETEQLLHDQLAGVIKDKDVIMNRFNKLEHTIANNTEKQNQLTTELEKLHSSTCPYCAQFYLDNEKITEKQTALDVLRGDIQIINEEYNILEESLSDLIEQQTQLKTSITIPNIKELLSIRDQSTVITARIEELTKSTNTYLEQINDYENIISPDPDYTELNELAEESTHQQFLHKVLTKKDSFIRKRLLQDNLTYLNTQLHSHLNKLGLPYKVTFNYQMIAEITQLGRSLPFTNLSNGQRSRVNLALSVAFRDVLQKQHAPINICILDEALDVGLDSHGIQAAIKMLKDKAREDGTAIFIITHSDAPKTSFDNIINVTMENEFSVIT
jgi:DNA repair exonuclease SbcCD ATPase subunit